MIKYLLASLFLIIATPAFSEVVCVEHEAAIAVVSEQYGEVIVFRGLGSDGSSVTEVYLNEGTGTYSIFIVRTDGKACLVDAGGYAGQVNTLSGDPT